MTPAAILVAGAPLVAALAALFAVYLTGFDQNLVLPVELESRFYGFYLDRYPLYAFALVYGLARVAAAALAPGPARVWRRGLGWIAGTGLVVGLSLHPTFGGYALRAAFATGGMAFLNQTPMIGAYLLGAAVAAVFLGLAMGIGATIAGGGWPRRGALWRRAARASGGLVAAYLSLWYAMGVLGLARPAGLGPWPHRPLDTGDALLAAACLTLAFLPHVLIVAGRIRTGPE